jgi:hypothetical protein
MQPTRRAFLFGRGTPQTPWQTFCQRLRRSCLGRVEDAGETGGEGTCRLTAVQADDLRHALALCTEYGVVLALGGVSGTGPAPGRSVLWVDASQMRGLTALPGAVPRWRAEPGVTLGELTRAGLPQFAGAPPSLTLGEWFADPHYAVWPVGRVDLSGIYSADVLLAGGEAETLGPFSADDGQPLRSAALQRLVPALFLTAARPDARWCRAQPAWPARYRIDALVPVAPATVNLAQMLHGHGGALAWVDSLVLQAPPAADESAATAITSINSASAASTPPPAVDDSTATAAVQGLAASSLPDGATAVRTLEGRVKSLFDPMERYAEVLEPTRANAT